MNRHGAIEITWAGGDHTFRLGLDEVEELEAATDMSIFLLHSAMTSASPFAKVRHYSETIRIGLIGGGMSPVDARLMVRRWVDQRPLVESVALAAVILRAALERVHTNEVDASSGEAETAEPNGSTSPSSEEMPS